MQDRTDLRGCKGRDLESWRLQGLLFSIFPSECRAPETPRSPTSCSPVYTKLPPFPSHAESLHAAVSYSGCDSLRHLASLQPCQRVRQPSGAHLQQQSHWPPAGTLTRHSEPGLQTEGKASLAAPPPRGHEQVAKGPLPFSLPPAAKHAGEWLEGQLASSAAPWAAGAHVTARRQL